MAKGTTYCVMYLYRVLTCSRKKCFLDSGISEDHNVGSRDHHKNGTTGNIWCFQNFYSKCSASLYFTIMKRV